MVGNSIVDGTGQIVLEHLRCTGSESRLIDCPHNGLGHNICNHAGVRCFLDLGIMNLVLKLGKIFILASFPSPNHNQYANIEEIGV